MTSKEALELVEQCGLNIERNKHAECKEIVISALEKQIPKKPVYKIEELFRLCPNCDFPLPLHFKFCNDCGQALDWENEVGEN